MQPTNGPHATHATHNAGQVVGIVPGSAEGQPPSLVRWQHGRSTVLPVHGDEIVPEDLNDRGQIAAVTVVWQPRSTPGAATTITARAYLIDGTAAVNLGVNPDVNEHSLYLNENGQVAGPTFINPGESAHGFLWDRGTVTTFDTGPTTHPVIMGINDSGQLAGLVLDDQDPPSGAHPLFRPAFRWKSGVMTTLDTGGGGAGPVSINRAGQIAGVVSDPADDSPEVVMWSGSPDAKPTRLGMAGADIVIAVNDHGDVLAASLTGPTASPGGYLWNDGRVVTLGTLGGLAAVPKALAGNGLVAGEPTSADGGWHATAWPPADPPRGSGPG